MTEDDWTEFRQRLIDASRAAIHSFSAEHPAEEVCYFAFDSEPCYGYVLIAINTSHSNLDSVRAAHEHSVKYRKQLFATPLWRDHAYYQVKAQQVLPFCDNAGDFAYAQYCEVKFPEWRVFAESDNYPTPSAPKEDYLESHVALLFAEALDSLAEDGSFETLKLASPTLLGFGFHDQAQLVTRMLRLPGS